MYLITLPVANSTDIVVILYDADGVKFNSFKLTAPQWAKFKTAVAAATGAAAITELK